MNHQNNYHRQVNFRLLCHVSTAGGVIGNSGHVIKNLETQTGCKIRFEDPLPTCHERVINISGDSTIDKKIEIKYNKDVAVVEVSRAQEGLIRVYERLLQVEGNDGGVVGCRLLAIKGQIGGLMGKGGMIVDGIRKRTGAKIKVLNKEELPACAIPEEELIQIMGGIIAVKKALVPVSRRLQICQPAERKTAHVTSNGAFHEQPPDFPLDTKSSIQPLSRNAVNHSSLAHSLSSDVDRVLNLDADSAQRKVVFGLLCSNDSAGGVIGRGAKIIKALEKDTGASISFSTPIARSKERVAIISSLESWDPLYSPAQVATLRVFERSIEVGREHKHIKAGPISARILVGPHEIKCLLDERGRVSSDIGSSTGVEVQLLGAEHAPNCAAEGDKVVQIIGELDNVKSALFQLTGRLREIFFSGMVSEGAVPRNKSCSTPSHSSQHEIGTSMPCQSDHLSSFSSLNQMDHLGFVPNLRGPHILLQGNQSKDRLNSKAGKPIKGRKGGWKSSHGGPERGRMDENGAAKKTITVSGQKISSVYGENGSNLARLKEISGAAVVLQVPGPGECDGKVIISGSPEQIQMAQSLLHAFILL
ncbi:KH domain-containing protein HEN4-like isoform X1 [Lycium barbarum]|uniref:KH domain-containing protein HEN4-like isoform X1 n=1 Tax=Lycium barbarum TaxID=112863 RepID=UPI00293E0991|nr:KH domain-containing protein HEN4-like isoform X1 [Lycium barbarum]